LIVPVLISQRSATWRMVKDSTPCSEISSYTAPRICALVTVERRSSVVLFLILRASEMGGSFLAFFTICPSLFSDNLKIYYENLCFQKSIQSARTILQCYIPLCLSRLLS